MAIEGERSELTFMREREEIKKTEGTLRGFVLENFKICMSMIEILAEDQDEITFNWDISGFFSMMSSTIMNRYFIKNLKLPTILAVPKSQIKNLKEQIKSFTKVFNQCDRLGDLFYFGQLFKAFCNN